MKRLLVACGVAASLLTVPTATAASTLTVNPAAPTVADAYTISGCGYAADRDLVVTVHTPFALEEQRVRADAAGCFTTAAMTAAVFGSYHADSYVIRKNGKSLIWQAGVSFVVS